MVYACECFDTGVQCVRYPMYVLSRKERKERKEKMENKKASDSISLPDDLPTVP